MNSRNRDLAMDRPITRRDFLQGVGGSRVDTSEDGPYDLVISTRWPAAYISSLRRISPNRSGWRPTLSE